MRLHRARLDTSWIATVIEGKAYARDFGSLIPEIKMYTRDIIPGIKIDENERIAIMRKGAAIRINDYSPSEIIPQFISVGLSWDVTKGKKIDLDISAICLRKNLKPADVVGFNNLTCSKKAIVHSGDELSGKEAGVDEMIRVDLKAVSMDIEHICFVITSFSGQELSCVDKASCVIFDTTSKMKIAMYTMTKWKKLDGCTALVMNCLYRNKDDWHI